MTADLIDAVAVVVPARDEAERLPGCLASVLVAARACRVPVAVVVVLDGCRDDSLAVARRALARHRGPWRVVDAAASCVADVRDDGIETALTMLRTRGHDGTIWVANTDADTRVPVDWLKGQVALAEAGADLVAGYAALDDDPVLSPRARHAYAAYMAARARDDGTHVHVYGANLGMRASTWRSVGGFPRVTVGEDTALVNAVTRAGGRVVRPVEPTVVTSARRHGRAPGGLAALLDTLEWSCGARHAGAPCTTAPLCEGEAGLSGGAGAAGVPREGAA